MVSHCNILYFSTFVVLQKSNSFCLQLRLESPMSCDDILYKKLLTMQTLFCHVRGFCRKNQEFSVNEKMHLQIFLYGNHPNDSLVMKVIDQIMGLCIKIIWCKNHDILFSLRNCIHK